MGYSMGGRLALHALIEQPKHFKAAIFISTHTGLKNNLEKVERLENDRAWATMLKNKNWEEFYKRWEKQNIFGGQSLSRQKNLIPKHTLAKAFEVWSLGHQENLLPKLAKIDRPLLFLSGEKDIKYKNLADTAASLSKNFQHKTIANASHRVPWEMTEIFVSELTTFLLRNSNDVEKN
jgi:2-succinyl-6-hydroxy-2,4-cyclohexadiene-1-carboxylate synthase